MPSAHLEEALGIARLRHQALLDGDDEAFLALESRLGSACEALIAAGPAATERVLDELIALETASLALLRSRTELVGQRLETLAPGARANRAYALSERLSVNDL